MTLGRDTKLYYQHCENQSSPRLAVVALTARKNGQETTHRSGPKHSASTYLRATFVV
jgi:hypothetical protein